MNHIQFNSEKNNNNFIINNKNKCSTNRKYIKKKNCLHIHLNDQFPRCSQCQKYGKFYEGDHYQSISNSMCC